MKKKRQELVGEAEDLVRRAKATLREVLYHPEEYPWSVSDAHIMRLYLQAKDLEAALFECRRL